MKTQNNQQIGNLNNKPLSSNNASSQDCKDEDTKNMLMELAEIHEKIKKERALDLNKKLLAAASLNNLPLTRSILKEAKKAKDNNEIDSLSPLIEDVSYRHSGWTAIHWMFYHKLITLDQNILEYLAEICNLKMEFQKTTNEPWFKTFALYKILRFNGKQTPAHLASSTTTPRTASHFIDSENKLALEKTLSTQDALGYRPGSPPETYGALLYSMGSSFFNSAKDSLIKSKILETKLLKMVLKSKEERLVDKGEKIITSEIDKLADSAKTEAHEIASALKKLLP